MRLILCGVLRPSPKDGPRGRDMGVCCCGVKKVLGKLRSFDEMCGGEVLVGMFENGFEVPFTFEEFNHLTLDCTEEIIQCT